MGMTPGKKRPERVAIIAPARASDASAKKKPMTAVAKADTKPTGKSAKPDKSDKSAKANKPSDKIADKAGAKKK
jgi:hypothetical protein